MADERSRVEIAFDGGQVMVVNLTAADADRLEQALGGEGEGLTFEVEEGRYTVAVKRVVYVKRFSREPRVGFGAA